MITSDFPEVSSTFGDGSFVRARRVATVCAFGRTQLVVGERHLIKLLAVRRWVAARNTGSAELVGWTVECPRDGFDRQIAERIGAQFSRHLGEHHVLWLVFVNKWWCEQLRNRRH